MAAPCYAGKIGRSRKVADNELQGRGGMDRTTHGGTLYERAERAERKHERAEAMAWSEHGALVEALCGVEAARPERGLLDPVRLEIASEVDECSWCGEPWTVEDMHDLTDFRHGGVILVCEVCDATGGY